MNYMDMKEEEVYDEENQIQNTIGFDGGIDDGVVDEILGTFGETEIWLGSDDQQEDNTILNDHHASIFCNDFPLLPDFPCMSSTSSSSSTPALTKSFVSASASASSASSANSSAASWTVLKSDVEEKQQDSMVIKCDGATPAPALSSTDCFQQSDCGMEDVNCMDVMESFGYMDLIEDGDDVWDPSTIFENDDDDQTLLDCNQDLNQGQHHQIQENGRNEEKTAVDELAALFFEWLKTNKERVSVEDMRSIKLKKATIECASKRLGNSKEGRIQLLKLILQWVEQYLHHKKRITPSVVGGTPVPPAAAAVSATSQVPCQYQQPFANPNSNLMNSNLNPCMMWIPTPQSSYVDPAAAATSFALHPPGFQTSAVPTVLNPQNPPGFVPPVAAYVRNDHSYVSGANVAPMPYPQPVQTEYQMVQTEYQMLDSIQYVLAPQFNSAPVNGNFAPIRRKPDAPVYSGSGERLVKLGASATKEARMKRMAHQRRSPWYHYRHQMHQNHRRNDSLEHEEQFDLENCNDDQTNCSNWIYEGSENCTNNNIGQMNGVNWVYWPAAVGVPMLDPPPTEAQQMQLEWQQEDRASPQQQSNQHEQVQSECGEPKQEFKYEKNLKFLLQKVLKQSDVGSLGRIVLPKKEAETQLPQLEARDGMPIAMEDIGTNQVWNLRYRFWPNNKSRMYLLENTGEFVKANGLKEGDFIVIYSDTRCGKYLIRGVKVREGLKLEAKAKAKAKANAKAKAARRNNHRNSAGGKEKQSSQLSSRHRQLS